jgi:hypothetical protein
MFRVDTSTAASSLPAQNTEGTPGYFSQGNAASGLAATVPGQDWFNIVQEELMAVVLAAGLTPAKATTNQVLQAIQRLARYTQYAADTGSANAYAISLSPALTEHIIGMPISFKAANTSTGPSTFNPGPGAVAIKKNVSTALAAGDIVAGQMVTVEYDGTYYQLINNGQAVDLSQFAHSFAGAGYQKLPGGLIIQWGTVPVGTSNSVTFPIAFPSVCAVVAPFDSGAAQGIFGTTSRSVTGFTMNCNISGEGSAYIALGY